MIKQIIFVALIALIFAQDVCTQKLINECENDSTKGKWCINEAYEQCDKAAKEKGADQTADINCLKFLLSARKECWPCICEVAKK